MDKIIDVEREAEKICLWGAARAGVIVVAPLVGTMALMANEVYMIMRLGELRGVKLDLPPEPQPMKAAAVAEAAAAAPEGPASQEASV